MNKAEMIISGIVLIIGFTTLAVSLILSAVLPNAFLVFLTANAASFGHDILTPNMAGPYMFSAITIFIGFIGMLYFRMKQKK